MERPSPSAVQAAMTAFERATNEQIKAQTAGTWNGGSTFYAAMEAALVAANQIPSLGKPA